MEGEDLEDHRREKGGQMRLRTAQKIEEIYNIIEEMDPEISTERLLQTTADEVVRQRILTNGNISDVCTALYITSRTRKDK